MSAEQPENGFVTCYSVEFNYITQQKNSQTKKSIRQELIPT